MGLPRMTGRRMMLGAMVLGTISVALAWFGWILVHGPGAVSLPAQEPRRFLGVSETVSSVAFAPNGRTLASGGLDGKVRLWDLADGRELSVLDLDQAAQVRPIAFGPGGETLIAGGNLGDGMIHDHPPGVFSPPLQIWDTADGVQLTGLRVGPEAYLRRLQLSADGRALATSAIIPSSTRSTLINASDECEQVILWYTATWTKLSAFTLGPGQVAATAFTPDLKAFAAVGRDGVITLYDTADGRPVRTLTGGRAAMSLAISHDGRTLAALPFGPSVVLQLWDLETGLIRESRPWPESSRWSILAFAPDGQTLAMTWNAMPGTYDKLPRELQQMLGITRRGRPSEVVLWDVASGRPRARLRAPSTSLANVAFSPDGRTVAAGGLFSSVILWDVPSDDSHAESATDRPAKANPEGREVWRPGK